MQISLHRTMLSYGGALTVHTASAGPIAGLDTLYLRILDDGVEALGEVRINIAYLNGLASEAVAAEATALLPRLDLARAPADLIADPPAPLTAASAPLRMLVDIALHDLAAKRAGLPLVSYLAPGAGMKPARYATNQTLFVSDDATLLRQAEAYVDRGFRDLKVRVGAADFADDMRRLGLLRGRFGTGVRLAADANGAWSRDAAGARLDALAIFALDYVEQPVAPAPIETLARLAEVSPLPIMLDESVSSPDDVSELAKGGHRLMAHLKLVKLGGIAPALAAADALRAAGVPFMIGQMNEGGIATAAALHLAAARKPRFAELYGADGIENDPASGLAYSDGAVAGADGVGLGMTFDTRRTRILWEAAR